MYKKSVRTGTLIAIFFLAMFVVVNLASASLLNSNVKNNIGLDAKIVGQGAGYESAGDNDALLLVQNVISIFLSVIGVLLLVYIIYGGYNWMTAHGEEEKVERAKDTIKRAIMGAIIIVAAYAISIFVMSRLEKGTLKGANAGPVIASGHYIERL